MVKGNVFTDDIGDGKGVLSRILLFLKENAATLPSGRHELEDGVFVVAKEYEPGDAATKRFETHVKYADVQYVVSGGEVIFVAPLGDLAVVEDRLDTDDIRFHADPNNETVTACDVAAGDYLLLLPDDAHKPECSRGIPSCQKCIAKIPVELL